MKLLMWFWLLTKRLYKKISFLAILLLIPALVLAYHAAAQGDSGMITVALSQQGDDALAKAWIESLDDSSQLIRFDIYDDSDSAEAAVRGGKADMAWIFREDAQARLLAFLQQPKEKNAMVTVLVRQDNVILRLAREKLSGIIYRSLSRQLYLDFVRENVPELSALSDDALMEFYLTRNITNSLFAFDETDPAMAHAQDAHYLTAPLRGLLAVVIALCGLATAMYYTQDSRRGTFSWVSTRKRPAVELGCQLVSLVNITAVAVLSLMLSGQSTTLLRELSTALLYCLCCAAFSMLLRRLCTTVGILAAFLPLLVTLMLVLCPVFFDFSSLRSLQYLLPPTYFINAIYNTKYLLYMLGYTGICLGLYGLLGLAKE